MTISQQCTFSSEDSRIFHESTYPLIPDSIKKERIIYYHPLRGQYGLCNRMWDYILKCCLISHDFNYLEQEENEFWPIVINQNFVEQWYNDNITISHKLQKLKNPLNQENSKSYYTTVSCIKRNPHT